MFTVKPTGNPVDKQQFYQTTKTLYVHCIDLLNSANLTKQVARLVYIGQCCNDCFLQAVRDLTGKLSIEVSYLLYCVVNIAMS